MAATRFFFSLASWTKKAHDGHQVCFSLFVDWRGTWWPSCAFFYHPWQELQPMTTKVFFFLFRLRKTWWPPSLFLLIIKWMETWWPPSVFFFMFNKNGTWWQQGFFLFVIKWRGTWWPPSVLFIILNENDTWRPPGFLFLFLGYKGTWKPPSFFSFRNRVEEHLVATRCFFSLFLIGMALGGQ